MFEYEPLTWEEAEKAFRERLALSAEEFALIADDLKGIAWTIARIAEYQVMLRVKRKLEAVIAAGETLQTFRRWLEADALGWTNAYTELVFRMAVLSSYSKARWEEINDPDLGDEFGWLMYDAVDDDRTRETHAAMDGKAWPKDEFPDEWYPPNGYNCFPAGALVSGNVEAVFRQFYSGELVELQTKRNGNIVVRVTPNHPIATMDGWKSAGDIKPGDKLLAGLVGGWSAVAENEKNEPILIEKLFELFSELAPVSVDRTVPEDFHGDALFGNGEVEIVRSPRILSFGSFAKKLEGFRNFGLPLADSPASRPGDCMEVVGRVRSPGSTGSFVGCVEKDTPRHGLVVDDLLFGRRPDGNTVLDEPGCDGFPGHSVSALKGCDALSAGVAVDQVLSVRRVPFSGHVYNLQTVDGIYLANGIIHHNCRCDVRNLNDDLMRRAGARPQSEPPPDDPDDGFRANQARAYRETLDAELARLRTEMAQ